MKHSTVKIIFCVFFLAGCGSFQREAPEQNHFTAALWNAHNLFDGVEAGTEYAEFRAEAGWTEEKYQARLTSLSQAILQMAQEPGSRAFAPDLIALAEIENLGVLEDLSRQLSSGLRRGSRNGYHWAAFSKLPGSAIGLGFLSRFPMTEVMAHSITIEGESAPRPVLEVRIEPGAEPLAEPGAGPGAAPMVFLLCHWKSKLGGADDTEALRRASARVVYRRLSEIKAGEPATPVIVLGDFNLNHDDFYRRRPTLPLALLPDDPAAALLAARNPGPFGAPDFLVLSGEKPPRAVYFPQDIHALYSPWGQEISDGSYYFRGGWESIDNFLLSEALFDGRSWQYAGTELLDRPPFTRADGTPNGYNPRTGRGLSDHLPMLLYLDFLEAN